MKHNGPPVYILAGGKSSRFGADKARALVDGVPLIVRHAESLRPIARSITVVASVAGAYDDLGLRTVGDVVEGKGPIGGLLTAARLDPDGGWIFVTACDWAGVRAAWVETLWERRRAGAEAVLFEGETLEPLFALYHASVSQVAASQIEAGEFAMWELLRRIPRVCVPAPAGWKDAVNVNRPSDLRF